MIFRKVLKKDISPISGFTPEFSFFPENVSPSESIKAGSLICTPTNEPPLSAQQILDYPWDQPRFKKILFIAPKPHNYAVPYAPSPSFGYLGELLAEYDFIYQICDLRLGGGINEVEEAITDFQPDVIGYTFQFSIGADFCVDFLKQIQNITNLPIIIGGPHLTMRGHNIMEDLPGIYAAVQKEGEFPLLALMKGVDLSQVPNLWQKRGDRVIENPVLNYNNELDALPWPKYHGLNMDRFAHKGQIDILTSRGCPHKCSFCSVALTQGGQFRQRSPKDVVDEVCYWYERGFKQFHFIDDILTANQKRFHTILDLILEQNFTETTFSCTQGMRADACTTDLLEKMKKVGFVFLGFGVESASDRILKILKKGETVAQIDHSIGEACKLGFDVGLFFIIGSPTETVSEVEQSFQLALKHPITLINFHIALPYPGTTLAKWVDEHSSWYVEPKNYIQNYSYYDGVVAFDNKGMGIKEQKKMLKKSMGINCIIRRRHAIRRMRSAKVPDLISIPLTHFVYNPYLFNLFRKIARTSIIGMKVRSALVALFNLDLVSQKHHDITFNDGK